MTTTTDLYNADGEQYRVIIRGELVGTFTDVEAACDAYVDHACVDCFRSNSQRVVLACCECCTVQTWHREAQP